MSRWDELVPARRVLKYNETGLAMQKGIAAQHPSATASSSKSKAATALNKDGSISRSGRKEGRGTKRGREEVTIPITARVKMLIALIYTRMTVIENPR